MGHREGICVLIFAALCCGRASGETTEFDAPHSMTILDNGADAFYHRIRLIESAEKSIYLEYFIYNTDRTSELLTRKLVEKADQGVDVRLLLDHSPYAKLNEFHVERLRRHGIQVKFYNPVSILRPISIQFRDHRKFLIVDGERGIFGGRNIGDEYFHSHPEFNFLDRDVLVDGPLVPYIQQSFLEYWDHPLAKNPKLKRRPSLPDFSKLALSPKGAEQLREQIPNIQYQMRKWDESDQAAASFVDDPKDFSSFESGYQKIYEEQKHEAHTCRRLAFVTNSPGKNFYSHEVPDFLYPLFASAKHELLLESPYVISLGEERKLFLNLLRHGVDIHLLTNSFHSTDASSVSSVFNSLIASFTSNGMKTFLYPGTPLPGEVSAAPDKQPVWGTHAKSFVVDREASVVGSFNLDPHSKDWNNEFLLVCLEGQSLANELSESILRRMNHAVQLDKYGAPMDGSGLLAHSSFGKRLEYLFLWPIRQLISCLL